jgi:hypothetical protein
VGRRPYFLAHMHIEDEEAPASVSCKPLVVPAEQVTGVIDQGTFRRRGVFRSAWPVGYSVGKASERIRSLPDASSIGVRRIEGAGTPGGGGLWPVIASRIRFASVVSWSRLKTTDWELGGASVGSTGPSRVSVSSVIHVTDEIRHHQLGEL